jgi:hypothetical protein
MIHLEVTVANTAELLAAEAYGAGALLRWESCATIGGTYTEGGTVPLVSGTSLYDIWDADGTTGTWYQTRISDATPTTYSAYSAPFQTSPSSLTTLAEVRALVRSRLSDADLQTVIDREEAWLAGKIGVLTGERTDTFKPGTTNTPLYLSRRTDSVSVTDDGTAVAAADLLFTPSTGCLRRVAGVWPWPPYPPAEPWFPCWQGDVAVTWTPTDSAAIKRAVIELVRGTVGETGMESETMGTYSYTRGASAGRVSRAGLVRGILLRRQAYSMSLRAVAEARP